MPHERDDKFDSLTLEKTKRKVKKPRKYKVILHNDDYTPMDWVTHVLEVIFSKTPAEATHIMLSVHQKGRGIAGVYPHDVAETKVKRVVDESRKNEYPLKCTMEPE